MSRAFQYLGTDAMGRPLVADGKPVAMARFASLGRTRYEDDQRVLFVLRESSTSAERELAGLATQVLLKHDYRKGVADLLQAGVQPLREPHLWNGKALTTSHGRISLVRVGNTWALYALSSAAKDTDGDQNAFTEALTRTMAEVRPHVVVTGSVSRLVRHPHHVSAVARAFTTCRPILECTERLIDFIGSPSAVEDLHEIATYAMRDRQTIVARMESGNLAAVYQGRFPFQGWCLPDGYTRTSEGVILLDAPGRVKVIQECLEMLADPTRSRADVARHIVASGQFSPRRRFTTVGSAGNITRDSARFIVGRLLDRPDVYESGKFEIVRRLSSPVPMVFENADPSNEVRGNFLFELPLPSGGWASGAAFEAIRQRAPLAQQARNRLCQTNPEKHSHQLPLAGFRWREGGTEWGIFSRRGGDDAASRYLLMCRPATPASHDSGVGSVEWTKSMRRNWGTPRVGDDRFVCLVEAGDLHRSIADAFGSMESFVFQEADEILGNPTPPGLLSNGFEDEVRTVESERQRAARIKEAARQAFYDLDRDDPGYAVFRSDYAEAAETVQRLTDRLAELVSQVHGAPPPPTWEADAGPVLLVLARVGMARGALPRNVVAALQAVLVGFTLRFDARAGEAVWSSALALPAANGSRTQTLQTQTGRVTVLPVGRGKDSKAPREVRALRRLASAGSMDAEERKHALDGMKRRGLRGSAAQSLVDAPVETRAVVVAHVLGDDMPDSVDSAFADLVIRAYVVDDGGRQFKWNAPAASRQMVLDELAHRGPTDRHDLMERLGIDEANWRPVDDAIRNPEGSWLSAAIADRHFNGASRDGGQHVTFRCRPCPHCGAKVDIVARVRECPAGLLCSACLRMPVFGSPVFPASYRQLAARPQRQRATTLEPPRWWAEVRRTLTQQPGATITVLAGRVGQARSEVQLACEAMNLKVEASGSAGAEWTDERLREEYLVKDRRLVDLADEIGISIGTLTKRLRRAGIVKMSRKT